MTILAPCGSRWLMELSAKLFDLTERHQNLAMRSDVFATRDVASEHAGIVKAVLSRDVELSIRVMNEHVGSTVRLVRAATDLKEKSF